MRFTRKRPKSGEVDVVITSLLDINFLLIMFFLMTAHFQRETHALLNLPQEKGEEKAQPDEAGLVINVSATGEIVVSNRRTTMDELRSMVRTQVQQAEDAPASTNSSAGSTLKLMIRADRDAPTEKLNRVVLMLRELGVGTIRIATEVPL